MSAQDTAELLEVLREVRDMIEGYADADHNGASYVPNDAMRAQMLIDQALAKASAA